MWQNLETLPVSNMPFSPTGRNDLPVTTSDLVLSPLGSSRRRFQAGYLHQRSTTMGLIKTWKKRYYRLRDDGIVVYRTKDHSRPHSEIRFTRDTSISWFPNREYGFTIDSVLVPEKSSGKLSSPLEPVVFQALSEEDRDQWASSIKIKVETRKRLQAISSEEDSGPEDSKESTGHYGTSTVKSKIGKFMDHRKRTNSSSHDRFHARYILQEEIGEGSFSVVRKATDRQTGEIHAVKFTKLSPALKEEIAILTELQHPNLVGLQDFFDCDDVCYVVMDYLRGGDLCDKLMEVRKYPEEQAKKIVAKLAQGIQYFHSKNVVHRDIKPENILLEGECVKIADFGLARKLISIDEKLTKTCGTPEYAAPEILEGRPYGISSDIFSLGVVTYIMLVGTFPFSIESANALQMLERFSEGKDVRNMSCLNPDAVQWGNVSKGAKDAVYQMLNADPDKRITANELLRHSWVAPAVISTEESNREEQMRKDSIRYEGFKLLLKEGIVLTKHGRQGTPHITRVQMEDDFIKWQSKHRFLRPRALALSTTSSSEKCDRETAGKDKICLRSVLEVREGFASDVHFRDYEKSDEKLCFSLVTESRSLYLEATTPGQRDWLLHGFRHLVEEIKEKAEGVAG